MHSISYTFLASAQPLVIYLCFCSTITMEFYSTHIKQLTSSNNHLATQTHLWTCVLYKYCTTIMITRWGSGDTLVVTQPTALKNH